MCGIFGILTVSAENIYKRIIDGLTQLQNRGYDSSGLAVVEADGTADLHKYASTDKIDSLEYLNNIVLYLNMWVYLLIAYLPVLRI